MLSGVIVKGNSLRVRVRVMVSGCTIKKKTLLGGHLQRKHHVQLVAEHRANSKKKARHKTEGGKLPIKGCHGLFTTGNNAGRQHQTQALALTSEQQHQKQQLQQQEQSTTTSQPVNNNSSNSS